jgi:hypothetical protein
VNKAVPCVDAVGVARLITRSQLVLLTRSEVAITSGCVTADNVLRGRLVNEVVRRQLSSGGWATNASSKQAALEPSCLVALALRSQGDAAHSAQEFLLRVQNPNGSWPAIVGDDRDGSWATSLAIIALREYVPGIQIRLRGFHWLLKFAGRESNWLWKWKFRTTDRHVRFDPDKYGWPWFPQTVSWVVPTSFAILALNQIPCTCGDFGHAASRVNLAIEMLIDRACPLGGWNAGNGMVYSASLSPHVDDTAVALLALSDRKQHPLIQSGVLWLERTIEGLRSPWSLAWAVLALAAHGRPIETPLTWLKSLPDLFALEDTSTLAVVSFALDYHATLSTLGVVI